MMLVYHAQRAVEIDPDLDMSNRALGFAYHQLSENQAASEDLAVRRQSAGNRERAIEHYTRAFQLNEQNYAVHNNLANLYLEGARVTPRKTRRYRQKICAMQSRNAKPRLPSTRNTSWPLTISATLIWSFCPAQKAADSYKNALRYKPDYPEGMNDLGAIHLNKTFPAEM